MVKSAGKIEYFTGFIGSLADFGSCFLPMASAQKKVLQIKHW